MSRPQAGITNIPRSRRHNKKNPAHGGVLLFGQEILTTHYEVVVNTNRYLATPLKLGKNFLNLTLKLACLPDLILVIFRITDVESDEAAINRFFLS
jgi:hypothetical protein